MKKSRWIALGLALCLLLGVVMVAFAFPYTVQFGDTLFSIARRYNTPVSALVEANQIANPELIYAGQKLEVPTNVQSALPASPSSSPGNSGYTESAVTYTIVESKASYVVQPGDTLYRLSRRFGTTVNALAQANHIANVNLINVGQVLAIPSGAYVPPIPVPQPSAPAAVQETEPVEAGRACTRFNFLVGKDRHTGSRPGLYVMRRSTGGDLASWYAKEGDVDSGWIGGIDISFPSVHVTVTFYPADGSWPILMEIVNPAGGTNYGWLSNGMCHAVEIQYPY